MANPDQKTILLEQTYEEIKVICTKFQDESGASDMEVKILLRELARVWEKENQIKRLIPLLITAIVLPSSIKAEELIELKPINPHSYLKSSLGKWEENGKKYLNFKGTSKVFDCFARNRGNAICSGVYTYAPDAAYKAGKTSIIDFKNWQTVLFEYDIDCNDKTYDRKGDNIGWTKLIIDQTPYLVAKKYCPLDKWNQLPNK